MANTSIERGIELINHCFQLQCEKDGVSREAPFEFSDDKVVDEFCRDITRTMMLLTSLYHTSPAYARLNAIGKNLINKGCIFALVDGEAPAEAALRWMEDQVECITPIAEPLKAADRVV